MMYEWTDEMIYYMDTASLYSGYFSRLADFIMPFIKDCRTVCDAGCGLGQLSAELGKRGFSVYACDISRKAVDYLKKKNYKNVIPVNCDLNSCDSELKPDSVVFNYFGSIEQIVDISEKMNRPKTVVIKKNYSYHRFSFTKVPIKSHTSCTAESYLIEKNIKFRKETFEAELGQPFRNRHEAQRFFEIYSHDNDKSIITWENIEKRLKKDIIPGFDYYLPHSKSSLVFFMEN